MVNHIMQNCCIEHMKNKAHLKKTISFALIINLLLCIVLYFIKGVVIAAQYTATFFKIYCAPPNLGIY